MIVANDTLEESMKYKSTNDWLKVKLPESYDQRRKESEKKAMKARENLPAYVCKSAFV